MYFVKETVVLISLPTLVISFRLQFMLFPVHPGLNQLPMYDSMGISNPPSALSNI
ncbi:hypothetical protein LINPERPRIM_LOCUS3954 [Linum perenne]